LIKELNETKLLLKDLSEKLKNFEENDIDKSKLSNSKLFRS
jgi:hypothetical protein